MVAQSCRAKVDEEVEGLIDYAESGGMSAAFIRRCRGKKEGPRTKNHRRCVSWYIQLFHSVSSVSPGVKPSDIRPRA